MTIKKTFHGRKNEQGMALVIVLGLLAVLTLLAVAFAIAMRVERVAARYYADSKRAEAMIHVGMGSALEDINDIMHGELYPDFDTVRDPAGVREAFGSEGTGDDVDLFTGQVTNAIAKAVYADADAVTPEWKDVTSPDGDVIGRIAYLVINESGLLDVNYPGGEPRVRSTNIAEIDPFSLPDLWGTNDLNGEFYQCRGKDVRYETILEFGELNSGIVKPVRHFTFYSYDVDRDVWPIDYSTLGTRDVALSNKFYLYAITNYAGYWDATNFTAYSSDADFMNDFYWPLEALLDEAGIERPEDVAWNVVNFLDPDRVPQSGESYPWRHSEGCEAVPLISEIVYRPIDNPPTLYEVVVEVWFPYSPATVRPSDGFKLQVGIFDTQVTDEPEATIMNRANSTYSWTVDIPEMTYGTETEILCFTSPASARISAPINHYFLARVLKSVGTSATVPVDEAMGYQIGDEPPYKRRLLHLNTPEGKGYSCADPRSNGQVKYWTIFGDNGVHIGGAEYTTNKQSLGSVHTNCNPWQRTAQGLPFYFPTNRLVCIGELGAVYSSNMDDEWPALPQDWWAQTINLYRQGEGAMLLDKMTVREGHHSVRGQVCINTRQPEVLKALFNKMMLGMGTNQTAVATNYFEVLDTDIDNLVTTIIANGPYKDFRSMFTTDWDGGDVGRAFRDMSSPAARTNDIMREGALSQIVDMISFRQNMFTIIVAAQVFSPDGSHVVAEKRAIATVYRDAYTGRHFTRSFRWVEE